jgi:flavin reductase (DIM6/NTAB) family NADH-FMN oxidoreductase RutF
MPVDPSVVRRLRGRFVAGITVVTTLQGDRPDGITVSSFTVASLEPPLVLVCLDRKSRHHEILPSVGRFAVGILGDDQEELSNRFAGKGEDKFAGVAWRRGELGVPLLEGCLATMECTLESTIPVGDHSVFVGRIERASIREEGEPLLYYRGGYRRVK